MNKYIIGIDGMMCGACEAHVQDVIRKNINVKVVKASHIKKELIVITERNLVEDDFHLILDSTGYKITSFSRTVASKTLFGWR
jgi:copper chaperone CopZ